MQDVTNEVTCPHTALDAHRQFLDILGTASSNKEKYKTRVHQQRYSGQPVKARRPLRSSASFWSRLYSAGKGCPMPSWNWWYTCAHARTRERQPVRSQALNIRIGGCCWHCVPAACPSACPSSS